MSTLKPLRKSSPRVGRRPPARRAMPSRLPISRLVAAGLVIAVVVVVGVLIVLARAREPVTPSSLPVAQAVRPLRAPTGQTAEGYWYKGNSAAPVTVTVFGDFQCPACRAAYQQIEGTLDRDYIETGKIVFVFHDFPLQQHANAIPTAAAARAAGAQGQFWAMHDLLYARQTEWENDRNVVKRLKSYATELGLDQQAFDRALDGKEYEAAIATAATTGQRQGINATPTYQVDGKVVETGGLVAAIDAALRAKGR